jgi:O-antigen/teichoic acid export membrane protein
MTRTFRVLIGRSTERLGPYARSAMLLASGTGAAQVIMILVAPILSRLYTPADYGAFATFHSISTILIAVAAGRYQLAVVFPDGRADAMSVATLALAVASVSSVVVAVLVVVFHAPITTFGPLQSVGLWLLLLPLAVFFGSTFECLTYVCIREGAYRPYAQATVLKAVAGGGLQVGFGALGGGAGGLIVGNVFSFLIGNSRAVKVFRSAVHGTRPDRKSLRRLAGRYASFPKYDLVTTLVNLHIYHLTVFGLGALYGANVVGNFSLAYRVLALPLVLVGGAVGQVFFREAARRAHTEAGTSRALLIVTVILAVVSVPPFLSILVLSEEVFPAVFGEGWREAGLLAAALVPMVWIRFVASPSGAIFLIYGRQRLLLVFQVAMFVLTAVSFYVAHTLGWAPAELVTAQSVSLGVVYATMMVCGHRISRRAGRQRRVGGSNAGVS